MVIHIFNEEKFTKPYIKFVNENFNIKQHYFYIVRYKNNSQDYFENCELITDKTSFWDRLKIYRKLLNAKKVILHGLFNRRELFYIFIQPWIMKKCYWVIWGGDLYSHDGKKNLKDKLEDYILKKTLIRNLKGIITHVKGDYNLACEWYGTRAKYYESFMYLSNIYYENKYKDVNKKLKNILVQVGNSADPTNNHLEIFEKIKNYNNIKVFCPLAYGDENYKKKIIDKGKIIFEDRFIYIDKMIPFEEYQGYLSKIDVAIFNHNRQQAMGNITTLLGYGKKVYLRNDITSWRFYNELGVKVWASNYGTLEVDKKINDCDRENNIEIVSNYFSLENLKKQQEHIFED